MGRPTHEELAIYNDIASLGEDINFKSSELSELSDAPTLTSVALYKRLWSNQQGFILLWRQSLMVEATIIARSALEVAICIAANEKLREGFGLLLLQDAAHTIKRRVKARSQPDDIEDAENATWMLQLIQDTLLGSATPARLQWDDLANKGEAKHLYGLHQILSGYSVHVTGLSMMPETKVRSRNVSLASSKMTWERHSLMIVAVALLDGIENHAKMIDAESELNRAGVLSDRLNAMAAD